ncbi:hypothetical protein BC629DRAFT_733548 [Irpex lacteus]|nr:hypothetical protein BC629DRAFT_733548 [Irpex lacteus]
MYAQQARLTLHHTARHSLNSNNNIHRPPSLSPTARICPTHSRVPNQTCPHHNRHRMIWRIRLSRPTVLGRSSQASRSRPAQAPASILDARHHHVSCPWSRLGRLALRRAHATRRFRQLCQPTHADRRVSPEIVAAAAVPKTTPPRRSSLLDGPTSPASAQNMARRRARTSAIWLLPACCILVTLPLRPRCPTPSSAAQPY